MKRLIYSLILVCFVATPTYAQEYKGVHSSSYLPFVGLVNQPGDLIRNDARWNVNLLSANIALMSDMNFASQDFWDVVGRVGLSDLKHFLGSEESLLYVKGRMMLPSLSYRLNDRHALAVAVSYRADGVYNSSNDDLLKLFKGLENPEYLEDIKSEYFRSLLNSWVEYAFSWSSSLIKTDTHWLTGGLTLKLLNGSGSGYLQMDDIDIMFDKEQIEQFDFHLTYGFNESLGKTVDGGDIVEQSGDFGVGVDIGLSYSYLPDHLQGIKGIPYRYKVGLAIADWGYIKHKQTRAQASYWVRMQDVPYSRFQGVESLQALKDSIEKSVDFEEQDGGSFNTKLPLTVGATLDYCLRPSFFVNTSFSYSPNYYRSQVRLVSRQVWRGNLTFRYEKRKWAAFLPLSYSSVKGSYVGAAARYGRFFVGSPTIFSALFDSHLEGQVFYVGMSIPIGRSFNE
ncbi:MULTISPECIES: DUF5723 family protein [unclassified Carboxylicivirga]|uniref:DUF5723 family protein n=1 Tax=Carboxylicivirga TaxID=1628153 RepID=UPI003D330CE6